MSSQEFNYPTHILTSKTPNQAALIIPNGLNETSSLINDRLLRWFQDYNATLHNYNQGLKGLIDTGSSFVANDENSDSNFSRNWNCLLTSLKTELESNESIHKGVKREIIAPLRDLMENDVRLSELLVNSQELQELSHGLSKNDQNAEFQWNYKAPHIFENFENFKSFEIQLLFDSILNFFQFHNAKLTKNLSNNENSTNYLLGSFKLKNEMNNYLNHIISTDFKPVNDGFFKQQLLQQQSQLNSKPSHHQNNNTTTTPKASKRFSTFRSASHSSQATATSSNNTFDDEKDIASTKSKKGSRLSRVGSMFGRNKNKRASKLQPNDTIPETESITTTSSAPLRNDLSKSQTRTSSVISMGGSGVGPSSSAPKQPVVDDIPKPQYNQPLPATPKERQDSFPSQAPQYYTKPKAEPSTPKLPPQPVDDNALDSPNVVKYNDSDSSDDEDVVDVNNNRLSMLQRHDLAPTAAEPEKLSKILPPPTNAFISHHTNGTTTSSDALLSLPRSRQSSAGKYSFEVGDDQKPIQSTPRQEQPNVFEDPQEKELPEPTIESSSLRNVVTGAAVGAVGVAAAAVGIEHNSLDPQSRSIPSQASVQSQAAPPRPPPSRKVVAHHQTDDQPQPPQPPQAARRITSQMFTNAPQSVPSSLQPNQTGISALVPQDTGMSLSKNNDIFKHFDASKVEEAYGLNASVAEVVNATFKDGTLTKSQVIGEVAFTYKQNETETSIPSEPILLSIPNSYDKLILNNSFVEKVGDSNEFKVLPSYIFSKTLGGFKYLKSIDQSQVPILIQQIWKFENHQASLVINLTLNSAYSAPVVLKNFIVSVALDGSAQASSALSKPQGAFNREKNRITWRYDQPLLLGGSRPTEERLIARFVTNGLAAEHESGVQIKFEIEDSAVNFTNIYFANTSEEIPLVRNLISGNYSGHI
ncbi:Muniscin C-terminal mu homology domain-containing protein [Scheffersomyces coipomensis]|uniref:Muniscin C-terminal mu homology domain-containing protein n=1 Tax=Scheffersomyces coipomensis TaxID=1788519 RepID=UPI00315DFC71